jgi:hypothetical protein
MGAGIILGKTRGFINAMRKRSSASSPEKRNGADLQRDQAVGAWMVPPAFSIF